MDGGDQAGMGIDESRWMHWSSQPRGGYTAFLTARAQALEALRVDTEIYRLEQALALPPPTERSGDS